MSYYKELELEDLEGEEWRDIKGFEGLYQVSNLGRVKSLQLWRGCNCRILRQRFQKKWLFTSYFI